MLERSVRFRPGLFYCPQGRAPGRSFDGSSASARGGSSAGLASRSQTARRFPISSTIASKTSDCFAPLTTNESTKSSRCRRTPSLQLSLICNPSAAGRRLGTASPGWVWKIFEQLAHRRRPVRDRGAVPKIRLNTPSLLHRMKRYKSSCGDHTAQSVPNNEDNTPDDPPVVHSRNTVRGRYNHCWPVVFVPPVDGTAFIVGRFCQLDRVLLAFRRHCRMGEKS